MDKEALGETIAQARVILEGIKGAGGRDLTDKLPTSGTEPAKESPEKMKAISTASRNV